MSTKKTSVTVLGIAATYVGTVIGAGYASGQEILQYFVFFGVNGIWSILLCGILFFGLGYFAIVLGRKLRTSQYQKIISPFKSKLPQHFSDIMIMFSLLGTFVIMIAGNSANFAKQFGLPLAVGGIVLAALCVVNLYFGLRGLVFMQTMLVPVMIVTAIGVSIYSIINPIDSSATEVVVNSSPIIQNWFMAAVLYVSFNVQLAIAVLVPMGNEGRATGKTLFLGTLLGGLLLAAGAFTEYFALISNASVVGTSVLPMVDLAGRIGPTMQLIYTVILFFGLYSTALSCFFGAYERISFIPMAAKLGRMPLLIIIAVVAFIASFVGFTKLVGYLYPLLGYGGIIIMALMTAMFYKVIIRKQPVAVAEQESSPS